jgi:type 1 glutamine amidotransferase
MKPIDSKPLQIAAAVGLAIATGQAAEPARILVCTVTAGYRHSCIPHAEEALASLDAASPGFEIAGWLRQPEIALPRKSDTPQAKPAETEAERKKIQAALANSLQPLAPDALRAQRIAAVIFCNTSGDLPLPDLDGFVRWVEDGGRFIAIHAGSDTLKLEARYTGMLCGVFDNHGPQVSATLHAGDPGHPANGGIGPVWEIPQEEIYLIRQHDPARVDNVWAMKHHPNHPDQPGHFPISWSRKVGKGRVFYTALGHREDLWSIDPALPGRLNPVATARQFRAHLLGGIHWTLATGD